MIGSTSFYNVITIILKRPYLVQGFSRNMVLNEEESGEGGLFY
jgi:hypothetical protein